MTTKSTSITNGNKSQWIEIEFARIHIQFFKMLSAISKRSHTLSPLSISCPRQKLWKKKKKQKRNERRNEIYLTIRWAIKYLISLFFLLVLLLLFFSVVELFCQSINASNTKSPGYLENTKQKSSHSVCCVCVCVCFDLKWILFGQWWYGKSTKVDNQTFYWVFLLRIRFSYFETEITCPSAWEFSI